MSTLGQMPKPEAGQYRDKRKLVFVPMLMLPGDLPDEARGLVERFWSEVRDNVTSLERSLGSVACVFHEALFVGGDEGLQHIEPINAHGTAFIEALVRSNARLEATEDLELLHQSSDWQRCMSVGLISEKVRDAAMAGFQDATTQRYEFIASRVDEALSESELGIMFLRQDHRVQFPQDIQVFYVSPPALNDINRWIEDQMRVLAQQAAQQANQPPPEELSDDSSEAPSESQEEDQT